MRPPSDSGFGEPCTLSSTIWCQTCGSTRIHMCWFSSSFIFCRIFDTSRTASSAPARNEAYFALAWASAWRSEEHTSELQSLMRISYAVFCLKKKTKKHKNLSISDTYDNQ